MKAVIIIWELLKMKIFKKAFVLISLFFLMMVEVYASKTISPPSWIIGSWTRNIIEYGSTFNYTFSTNNVIISITANQTNTVLNLKYDSMISSITEEINNSNEYRYTKRNKEY